jgi:carboxyl-terminal processing protease
VRSRPTTIPGRVVRLWSAVLAAAILLAGCATRVAPRPPELAGRLGALSSREAANLRIFDRVWDLTNRKFYDARFEGVDWRAAALAHESKAVSAANDEQLYAELNAMLGELKNSHTVADTPKEVADELDRPRARIGIAFGKLENRLIVLDVLPGSPAAEAGVRPGWFFLTRDGKPLSGEFDLEHRSGDTSDYGFVDENDQPRSITLRARLMTVRQAKRRVWELAGGVIYLRFDAFDWTASHWLSAQLKAHRTAPAVVIDLRWNPGGVSVPLGFAIGEFFSKGVTWGRFISHNGWQWDAESWQWGSARYGGRVAVLVGENTASCAEIFARTLQYYQRAVVIGRQTAGAVTGARWFPLPDGGRLELGMFDYRDPNGRRLEGAGVKPDIPVTATFDSIASLRAGRDLDLAAALAALKTDGTNGATLAK